MVSLNVTEAHGLASVHRVFTLTDEQKAAVAEPTQDLRAAAFDVATQHAMQAIRRNPLDSGSIYNNSFDLDRILATARAEQSKVMVDIISMPFRAIARSNRLRKAVRELSQMTDYELKDIGLSRGDIRTAVYGRPAVPVPGLAARFRAWSAGLAKDLAAWRKDREIRASLNRLDDHLLADIGMGRERVNIPYVVPMVSFVSANDDHPRSVA